MKKWTFFCFALIFTCVAFFLPETAHAIANSSPNCGILTRERAVFPTAWNKASDHNGSFKGDIKNPKLFLKVVADLLPGVTTKVVADLVDSFIDDHVSNLYYREIEYVRAVSGVEQERYSMIYVYKDKAHKKYVESYKTPIRTIYLGR